MGRGANLHAKPDLIFDHQADLRFHDPCKDGSIRSATGQVVVFWLLVERVRHLIRILCSVKDIARIYRIIFVILGLIVAAFTDLRALRDVLSQPVDSGPLAAPAQRSTELMLGACASLVPVGRAVLDRRYTVAWLLPRHHLVA